MSAPSAARTEAEAWAAVATLVGTGPTEGSVVGTQVLADLERRARRWGHRFESAGLGELCLFAAGLAVAEAEAWERDDPTVATRAFEDRRFLASDRIVWWAVPWALAHQPEVAEILLELGERLRLAPALTGSEGLVPPGEDAFGPVDVDLFGSLLSAGPWEELAERWPGTARLWTDLATRSGRARF
ncbi:MAG: hypothetical protein OEX04_19345 [Acidimicrobiia bacterium]|nr:hypothetical protein [Acidimicrobiia bacterium]MDH4309632.1 hypothetical protein [Acidimicrobiia bacterium]MDH5292949.1 hypothetical protein [Acidimicrobiia bacterium]